MSAGGVTAAIDGDVDDSGDGGGEGGGSGDSKWRQVPVRPWYCGNSHLQTALSLELC